MNGKNIQNFLVQLSDNNSREWFNLQKDAYTQLKLDFELFINQVIAGISAFDTLGNITAKDCVFRIYRDTRFSNNKLPYKTNFGAYIAGGGRKSTLAGYYFHLEPGKSFAGGGLYMPDTKILNAVRNEIYENEQEFTDIIHSERFKSTFDEMWGDKLQRAPKGFSPDFKHIEFLKMKSIAPIRNLSDAQIQDPKLIHLVIDTFKQLSVLNKFFNRAMENAFTD